MTFVEVLVDLTGDALTLEGYEVVGEAARYPPLTWARGSSAVTRAAVRPLATIRIAVIIFRSVSEGMGASIVLSGLSQLLSRWVMRAMSRAPPI